MKPETKIFAGIFLGVLVMIYVIVLLISHMP